MDATKLPSECLWRERWPVWGYVCVESAQSSSFSPHPLTKIAFYAPALTGLVAL